MVPEDPPVGLATPDEVIQAIESLSPADHLRLIKAARICIGGTDYKEPMEILNEAFTRTLNGAVDGPGHKRRWQRKVEFVAFLIVTMEGLASDSRDSALQTKTAHLEGMVPEGGTVEQVLGGLGHTHAEALTQVLDDEDDARRAAKAQEALTLIYDHFADDQEVLWIIEGLKDDTPPAEVRRLSGMTQTQYETAKRRIRRAMEKLFSGKRPL